MTRDVVRLKYCQCCSRSIKGLDVRVHTEVK